MFTREELLKHYETMVKIRKFDLEAKRAARPVKYWAMCMFMLARKRLRPAFVHALNARITLKVRIAAMDTPLQRVLSLIR